MLKVFKKEVNTNNSYEIRIFDMENGEFTHYFQDKTIGFTFSSYNTTVYKMGYKSIEDCLNTFKKRGFLGKEIDYEQQKELEKIGLINLGIDRIKRKGRINTNDFTDVIEKLQKYGLGFVDAQNIIIASYLNI